MSDRFSEIEEQLPPVPKPGGNYVHAVRAGNLLFLAGKGALAKGKVGIEFTKEQAYQFARETGLILLAVMKQELGTLRRVKRVVKVLGMVNATAAPVGACRKCVCGRRRPYWSRAVQEDE